MANTRKYLIAGNWKMNKTAADAEELIKSIVLELGDKNGVGVVVCPPFTSLESSAKVLSEVSNVQLGAQNMHAKPSGAYTGEISAAMLRQLYVSHVILGHSERREYFKETDEEINEKVLAALESNLKPILCVGEKLDEREAGNTLKVVETQLLGGLVNIPTEKAEQVVIAYEPVWAIGTGKTATPEMAQEVHGVIRVLLRDRFGKATGDKIRILYGGSMKPENADGLLAKPDIDGGLIGGASLDAKSFVKLVESAAKAGA
ncbi:triose-phosphate isomerase [Cerasicoccus arenae]|uniref:Triosephosphate isomerase n=1 Tax=Cerasicoccus arenae TaxID=424488 RepID=A0A8J3DJ00_9BACT|nr:triose-phosphate isomerase [Cerasicoccus arenae]GHC04994.1 triosephosphate isomerase [Cerasicoccus arenae]